jgi:uncharacterized membrane protein HdeD (DUF308 family)
MFDPLRRSRDRDTLASVDFDDVREHPGRFIALGVALVVLGALAILLPVVTAVVTTVALGWLLVLGGLAEGIHAVADRRWGGSGWAIAGAALYVVAGVLVAAFPMTSKLVVTLVLSGFLVGDGVLKIVRAALHQALPGWGWLIFDGVLAIALGGLLWLHWPSSAAWALGLLVGIDLVCNGTSMLVIGLGAGRVARARP